MKCIPLFWTNELTLLPTSAPWYFNLLQPIWKTYLGLLHSIIKSLLEAVAYLNENDIVHRDIKPENILFQDENDDTVKLIDFGFARRHTDDDPPMSSPIGTSYYVSPEILKCRYDKSSCDVWAVGTIAYIMLSWDIYSFCPLQLGKIRAMKPGTLSIVCWIRIYGTEYVQLRRHWCIRGLLTWVGRNRGGGMIYIRDPFQVVVERGSSFM